ncbi:MAG: hypothetical protein O9253_01800 [Aquidulcibacter sp.]|nr:hypothetical protein [Aquidulcibacter sp.]
MRTRVPFSIWAPIVIMGISILAMFYVAHRNPTTQPVYAPVNLANDAVSRIKVTSRASQMWVLGVELDEQTAKWIFPCIKVSPEPDFECKSEFGRNSFEVKVFENGLAAPSVIGLDTSYPEWRYYSPNYVHQLAFLDLKPDKQYEIAVTSLIKKQAVAPSQSRLVLMLSAGDALEENGSTLLMAVLVMIILTVCGIWLAISILMYFLNKKHGFSDYNR